MPISLRENAGCADGAGGARSLQKKSRRALIFCWFRPKNEGNVDRENRESSGAGFPGSGGDGKEPDMRQVLFAGMMLLAGCQNVVGPFQARPQRVDDPTLTIEQQQQRGRQQLALPNDQDSLAPKTYSDRPGPLGR
jgi:hypothetical protein